MPNAGEFQTIEEWILTKQYLMDIEAASKEEARLQNARADKHMRMASCGKLIDSMGLPVRVNPDMFPYIDIGDRLFKHFPCAQGYPDHFRPVEDDIVTDHKITNSTDLVLYLTGKVTIDTAEAVEDATPEEPDCVPETVQGRYCIFTSRLVSEAESWMNSQAEYGFRLANITVMRAPITGGYMVIVMEATP